MKNETFARIGLSPRAGLKRIGLTAALVIGASALASCTEVTDPTLGTVTGEWCTLRGLASSDLPAPGVAFIGMVLFQDGTQMTGSGSVSRPGDPEIIPSRYQGSLAGGSLVLDRTDLETDRTEPGPLFTLALELEGRDLVGVASGDGDFSGPVHLVRLGPRCFQD